MTREELFTLMQAHNNEIQALKKKIKSIKKDLEPHAKFLPGTYVKRIPKTQGYEKGVVVTFIVELSGFRYRVSWEDSGPTGNPYHYVDHHREDQLEAI